MTEEPNSGPPPGRERPILLWIIVGWQVYSALSSFYVLGMGLAGKLSGPAELTAIYKEHPLSIIASTTISAALQGAGAISLVYLRRVALWFFLGAALFSLFLSFQRMEGLKQTGISGEMLALVVLSGLAIQLAVCGYVWTLDRRGVLR